MIKLIIVAFLAAASAAPHFHHRRHPPFSHGYDHGNFELQPYFGEELFDTNRFWRDLEIQLRQMDEVIANLHQHFPTAVSTAVVDGNEYKVTIPLQGFDEKDIIVKAREGVLMVQAVHKVDDSFAKNYLELRTLPSNLEVSGVWTFENEVLTIVFPIKGGGQPDAPVTEATTPETYEIVTKGLDDREEMESTNDNDTRNADVGLENDKTRDHEIMTNEIQNSVEGTTYAVDLKDEVEFVPVHYK